MRVQENSNGIYLTRGDSATLYVSVDGLSLASGDIVEMTVRKWVDDPEKKIYKKVTSFSSGKATIKLNPADTSNLEFGKYVYDVQLTHSGEVCTIVTPSVFEIGPEVTYG